MTVKFSLTSAECECSVPQPQRYGLADGGGLHLIVLPSGKKAWHVRYRINGRQRTMVLGNFPDISLKEARLMAADIRSQVAKGIDPQAEKQQAVAEKAGTNTFRHLADEWFSLVHMQQVVPKHHQKTRFRLEGKILPVIGSKKIQDITPPVVLALLRDICDRGHIETAHRVKTIISQVFRYAISTTRAERDPTQDLAGLLPASKEAHFPAILDIAELGALLRSLDGYSGSVVVASAARMLPLVFCRPGELRAMMWQEIDPAAALWVWSASKGGVPMMTPLSKQAMQILAGLRGFTGSGKFVFPSLRGGDRPISDATIKAVLDSLGYKGRMTSHGWRAVARTHLVETLGYSVDIVEMQLGHNVRDALGRAYNRTTFLEQRREMMQKWADWLDDIRRAEPPAASPVRQADPWDQWLED